MLLIFLKFKIVFNKCEFFFSIFFFFFWFFFVLFFSLLKTTFEPFKNDQFVFLLLNYFIL